MSNIVYKTSALVEFFNTHRYQWEDFYDSEKTIMDRIMRKKSTPFSVLDVGCGCGGLGRALSDRFTLSFYKGMDINRQNIEFAVVQTSKKIKCKNEFILEDVVKTKDKKLYDMVISLGCVDWNVDTNEMINKCWERVAEGGYFVLSVRLTNQEGINDIKESYQKISRKEDDNEVANYVVFNYSDILEKLSSLGNVKEIEGYGYWGAPSATAITKYDRLCFSVLAVQKGTGGGAKAKLEMPLDLFY